MPSYLNKALSLASFCFPAMDPNDEDDLLFLLLSYECPVTGKKRTAGSYDTMGSPIKRNKFLGCNLEMLSTKHPSRVNPFLRKEFPPCYPRFNVTEPDEKASSSASPMPTCNMSTDEGFSDPNQDDYFHRGVGNTGATLPMCPEVSPKATAMAKPSADWLKSPYVLFLIFWIVLILVILQMMLNPN